MKRDRREFVIDGYNLMHKLFALKASLALDSMRQNMERELLLFQQRTGHSVRVVYDGKGSRLDSTQSSPLHILFTPASISADHWIIEYVKSLNTKVKMVTIVSSDEEIRRYASAFGATCMASEAFVKELNKRVPSAREGSIGKKFSSEGLSDKEVARWKELFTRGPL
ncbi:MAG: NYN domain-containing protein [Chlorobiaceae bacterium]